MFNRSIAPAASFTAITLIAAILMGADAGSERELSDPSITLVVENELKMDPAVPNGIEVSTESGIVQLDGTVNSILAKERAERIAETVRGVILVNNRVTVDPGQQYSADELAASVEGALLRDPATDAYEVDVEALDGGNVTLSGTVDSWQEKQLAATVAKSVAGVTMLNNQINVNAVGDRSDVEIQRDIEQSLRWDTRVDDALIDVEVTNGSAVLTGTVGSAAERTRAYTNAWVDGVNAVSTDGLKIEQWARNPEMRGQKYENLTDNDIKNAVEEALIDDPRVMSFRVTPEVSDGVVTLRGKVDNLQASRAAENLARTRVGVTKVENELQSEWDQASIDDSTEDQLEAALRRDPYIESYEVSSEIIDGTAYLNGTVDTYFEKARADEVAATTRGVRDVKNNLDVDNMDRPLTFDPFWDYTYDYDYDWYDYSPTEAIGDDASIRKEIVDELWWSPFVDEDEVAVSVEDGKATLTGVVDSWMEYNAATENAYEGGAQMVDNNLEVQ